MLVSTDKYNTDCVAIRDSKFHHDDSYHDRSAGGALDTAFRKTTALWGAVYDREYEGMYRGEPPKLFFANDWSPCEICRDGGYEVPAGVATSSGKKVPDETEGGDFVPWAYPNGRTSDGRPAFHRTEPGRRYKPLQGYIFGRVSE